MTELDRYEVGPYGFDGHHLHQGRRLIALKPQAARVLRVLLELRHRLVSQDEILKAIQAPKSSKGGFDQILHGLRKQLGAHRDIIETDPGRGYRIADHVRVKRVPCVETTTDVRIGRRYWNTREPRALARAMECFERAELRSPYHAEARAAQADCYAILGSYNWTSAAHAVQKARACASDARNMQSDLAAPHATFGFLASLFEHRWEDAERHFHDALACDPSYGTAHHWLALQHAALDRPALAREHIELARKHDPLSPVLDVHAAMLALWDRNLDAARHAASDATTFNGYCWYAWTVRGTVAEAEGRWSDAIGFQKEAASLFNGSSTMVSAALARAHALSGDPDAARRTLEPVVDAAKHGSGAFHIATAYAALGEKDAALDLLERAIDQQDVWVSFLAVDPRVDALRSDRRFSALQSRLRLA